VMDYLCEFSQKYYYDVDIK